MSSLDPATWAALIGTWVLVVGTLMFAYWQLRQTQRLHSASTLLELRERFFAPRMRQARRDLSSWLLRPAPRGDEPDNWEVGLFFEMLGSLTHSRALEKRLVWSSFGTWVSAYYVFTTRPENLLARWRADGNDPLIFAEFEWLARQVIEMDARASHVPATDATLAAESRVILEAEAHVTADSDALAPR